MKPQTTPTPDFEIVRQWFGRARDNARKAGKTDSAELWGDGLQHLLRMKQQKDELLGALRQVARNKVGGGLQTHIEDILTKNGVALSVYGHYDD